jgi:peptidase E
MSNIVKGRDSYDSSFGNVVVTFFNRNITPYPTEAGGPAFDLVPVTRQKDIMLNVARIHAQQEYDRIMELVAVLQRQAADIKRRLDLTDMVHQAKYSFQIAHGQTYWLVQDTRRNELILCGMGPAGWSAGAPVWYEYIVAVKWLGDHTWIEVKENTDGN